ncbi:MAG: hypothetical protein AAF447_14790 [Myxococcota bacterium]
MDRVDLWVTKFRPVEGETAEAGLQRIFGVDGDVAQAIVSGAPCIVKRGVDRARIPVFLRALDTIGALVEVRSHASESEETPPVSLEAPALAPLAAVSVRSGPLPTTAPPAPGPSTELPAPTMPPPPIDVSGGLDIDASAARPSFGPVPAPAEDAARQGMTALDESSLASELPGLDEPEQEHPPSGVARRSFGPPEERATSRSGDTTRQPDAAMPSGFPDYGGGGEASLGEMTFGSDGLDDLDGAMSAPPLELDLDTPPAPARRPDSRPSVPAPGPPAMAPPLPEAAEPKGPALRQVLALVAAALVVLVGGLWVAKSLFAPDLDAIRTRLDDAKPAELQLFRSSTPEARSYFFETTGARLAGMTSAESREFVYRLYFTGALEVRVLDPPDAGASTLLPPVAEIVVRLPDDAAQRLAIENAYWQRVRAYAERAGVSRREASPRAGDGWWIARVDFGQR